MAGVLKERLEDRRLETRRIYIDNLTPELTEYMASREQVHKTKNEKELQSRLKGNRLGFGLFHGISGEFPLAMVYVALSNEFPNTIDKVFGSATSIEDGPHRYAVFYTISLCNLGARRLGMSHILLSSTLRQLAEKYPEVEHFQTLSPIIKFREWLERNNPECPPEMYLQECQRYLEGCYARTVNMIDPVAGFHYENGAILDRVLPGGNPRATASYGMMASYKYEPRELEHRASVYRQNKRDAAR